MYWGHRFLSSNLSAVTGKKIFKVSFYELLLGNYEVHIYKGTGSNVYGGTTYYHPVTELANKNIVVTEAGWQYVEFETPISIDNSKDLWVFIYDPEAKSYPGSICEFTGNVHGAYISNDVLDWTVSISSDHAFLIRTYLTDGTYTYNLYNDGVKIAENLTETSYSNVTLNNNATNQLVVKTQRDSDEFPSNMVGSAKGNASVASLELGDNDMMTVTENATLTISGTASNDDAAHLILENGAQLVHNSTGVKATMKKNIEAYTGDDNGW